MSKQTNVTVSRYVDKQLGWESCIRPDDGSWVMFIPRPGDNGPGRAKVPALFHRIGTCVDENGTTHDSYATAESPEFKVFVADHGAGLGPAEAFDKSKCWPLPGESTP